MICQYQRILFYNMILLSIMLYDIICYLSKSGQVHMIENMSCSSLSSFENYDGYQYQINNRQTKTKYQNNFEKKPKFEQQSCQFSQFDDALGETLQIKLDFMRRQDKLQKMRRQLQQLKQDNYHLSSKNQLLQKQIERFRQEKRTLEVSKNQKREQLQQQQQHQKSWRKSKIQTLLKQLQRVKQSINKLRRQSEKDKSTIYSLKQQLTILSEQKMQWAWKQKFIILFIDMTKKISEGFDENWSDKKKIQIGWKVVKSLMHRVFENGIKPPKIKTSQL